MSRTPSTPATLRTRALLAAALLFVVALGAWGLSLPRRQDARLPDEAAARRCGARLAQGFEEGDVVRVAPAWWREHLASLLGPIEARTAYPFAWHDERDPLVPEHLWRARRLWQVHLPALTGQDLTHILPAGARVSEEVACSDTLELALVDPPRATLRFDLLRDLPGARVERVEPDGRRHACRFDGATFRCGGPGWKDVGAQFRDAGGSTRECVYVEPAPDGSRVEITFPSATLGARTLVWGGMTLTGARHKARGGVRLEVRVAGRPLIVHDEPTYAYQWNRFEIDTSDVAGAPLELVLAVGASKAGWRQFCLDALSADPEVAL